MLLAEEFVLLTLEPESGRKTLSGEKYGPVLAAALLVEPALMERVSVTPQSAGWLERGTVSITSSAPTDDTELDRSLQTVEKATAKKGSITIGSLISDLAWRPISKGLHERLLERLVRAGVLEEIRTDVLGLRRWPTVDLRPEEAITAEAKPLSQGDWGAAAVKAAIDEMYASIAVTAGVAGAGAS